MKLDYPARLRRTCYCLPGPANSFLCGVKPTPVRVVRPQRAEQRQYLVGSNQLTKIHQSLNVSHHATLDVWTVIAMPPIQELHSQIALSEVFRLLAQRSGAETRRTFCRLAQIVMDRRTLA